MLRPARLFVVLLTLAISAGPLVDCVVDPTSASQMACCVAMTHDCGAAGLEDDCCPTGGSDGRQVVTSSTVQVHPAPLIAFATWSIPVLTVLRSVAAFEAFDREILKLPERPTYLLVSSFLI